MKKVRNLTVAQTDSSGERSHYGRIEDRDWTFMGYRRILSSYKEETVVEVE